jgi:hypothetical protein
LFLFRSLLVLSPVDGLTASVPYVLSAFLMAAAGFQVAWGIPDLLRRGSAQRREWGVVLAAGAMAAAYLLAMAMDEGGAGGPWWQAASGLLVFAAWVAIALATWLGILGWLAGALRAGMVRSGFAVASAFAGFQLVVLIGVAGELPPRSPVAWPSWSSEFSLFGWFYVLFLLLVAVGAGVLAVRGADDGEAVAAEASRAPNA